ncbi:MAG: hypothetical protein GY703_24450 [Gammaproteobacteria bacterium]|nr:hypothetical protein [Gammaproteobacteria bacterium]
MSQVVIALDTANVWIVDSEGNDRASFSISDGAYTESASQQAGSVLIQYTSGDTSLPVTLGPDDAVVVNQGNQSLPVTAPDVPRFSVIGLWGLRRTVRGCKTRPVSKCHLRLVPSIRPLGSV